MFSLTPHHYAGSKLLPKKIEEKRRAEFFPLLFWQHFSTCRLPIKRFELQQDCQGGQWSYYELLLQARHRTRNKRCLVPATCSSLLRLHFNCNPNPFLSCWGAVVVVHQIIWSCTAPCTCHSPLHCSVQCAVFQLLEYHQHQAPALGSGAPDNFSQWIHPTKGSPT